jgi:hypothetical protein
MANRLVKSLVQYHQYPNLWLAFEIVSVNWDREHPIPAIHSFSVGSYHNRRNHYCIQHAVQSAAVFYCKHERFVQGYLLARENKPRNLNTYS